MTTLNIISAGAAKAIVTAVAEQTITDKLTFVNTKFGAVGALLKDVEAGNAFDVIILTNIMIDQLVRNGYLDPDSKVDIGSVSTGVAVHHESDYKNNYETLDVRSILLDADRLVCPDPSVASAGRVLLQALSKLELFEEVKNKLEFFENGAKTIEELTIRTDQKTIGIVQVSEIVANRNLVLLHSLPERLQEKIIYSVAISNKATDNQYSRIFVNKLTQDKDFLKKAGFDPFKENLV
ncbi:MAG: molybdate ABC transporter substrate-binding protein [Advenella sp.]|uniref:molybdate ABC transporter substrate-binding protein n=1 Tax=Advenella sp. TaxID=1872388 RepID=UPI003F9D3B59